MVHFRSEFLFPARVMRWGIRAAYVSPNDARKFAYFSNRPLKIGHCEPTAFPVRDRLFNAQAIEIDRDINIFAREAIYKVFEMVAPVIAQDRAFPLSIFQWPVVCPRMHFKISSAFGATIAENLVREPTFEIAAAPNAGQPHI